MCIRDRAEAHERQFGDLVNLQDSTTRTSASAHMHLPEKQFHVKGGGVKAKVCRIKVLVAQRACSRKGVCGRDEGLVGEAKFLEGRDAVEGALVAASMLVLGGDSELSHGL